MRLWIMVVTRSGRSPTGSTAGPWPGWSIPGSGGGASWGGSRSGDEEVESAGRSEGLSEGVKRYAVVGMKDPPGFDVGDCPFHYGANLGPARYPDGTACCGLRTLLDG